MQVEEKDRAEAARILAERLCSESYIFGYGRQEPTITETIQGWIFGLPLEVSRFALILIAEGNVRIDTEYSSWESSVSKSELEVIPAHELQWCEYAPLQMALLPGHLKTRVEAGYGYYTSGQLHYSCQVTKADNGNFFHWREDGSLDLFIRRGSRELGPRGFMWARWVKGLGFVEGIDPLGNTKALTCEYTPMYWRVLKVVQEARGINVPPETMFSIAVDMINGNEETKEYWPEI